MGESPERGTPLSCNVRETGGLGDWEMGRIFRVN